MQLIFTKKKSESKISWMIWKSWQTKLRKAKLKEALFCAMKKQMKTIRTRKVNDNTRSNKEQQLKNNEHTRTNKDTSTNKTRNNMETQ